MTRSAVDTLDDGWELSADTAHPNAARLLKDAFYWDVCDESSPFGNHSGADALELYRAAIDSNPELDSSEFLDELFEQWDVDRDFAEGIPDEELAYRLEREHFHIITYDDVVVAVAFAEIVFLGNASTQMALSATRSLKRQSLPEVLEFRGWSDPSERRSRCEEMIEALSASA
jgi:uncharacterized protein YfeS